MVDYQNLSQRLAAFDDTPEREEIAALELEQKKDRLAIESADSIIAAAKAELTRLKTRAVDVDEVVEDLREGKEPESPKESQELLENRIEAHILGKRKLHVAITERGREIDGVQTRLRLRMAEHATDVAQQLDTEIDHTVDQLVKLYADIDAIGEGLAVKSAIELRRKLRLLFRGLNSEWPQVRKRTQTVSPELVSAMKQCESTIKLVDRKIPEVVTIPEIVAIHQL